MSETIKPRLWSDFDGTAVAIAKKTNPQNWSKYPLPLVPGFNDFLRGVTTTNAVEFAGFISRRPNIAPRRWATMRSISKLGINGGFTGNEQVVLAGSEQAKGHFLVEQSRLGATVGMIEDKPHKLGAVVAGALREAFLAEPHADYGTVVMGVVAHEKSHEYARRLVSDIERDMPGAQLGFTDGICQIHLSFSDGPRIDVVPLDSYSHETGLLFAERLTQTV